MESYILTPWIGGIMIGLFVVMHFIIIGEGVGSSTGYICAIKRSINSDRLFFGYNLDSLKFWFLIGMPIGGFIHLMIIQDSSFILSFDIGMYEGIYEDMNKYM